LPLALAAVLMAVAATPAVAKAVGLYREFEVARTPNYHPDPIFPWLRDNLEGGGVLLARDSANNVIPAYSTSLGRGEPAGRGHDQGPRGAGAQGRLELGIPRRYWDVHRFFFGPTLDAEAHEILRRHGVDYLMVYAGGPLDRRLKTLPGLLSGGRRPQEKYGLYTVNLQDLGAPARGSDRPRDVASPSPPKR
jgi:hypothetical protein